MGVTSEPSPLSQRERESRCLTGQRLRLATATAITDCEIMRLEKATMIRVLHEEPAFSEVFVSMSGYDFGKGQGIIPTL